jgi:hypothetical protein
MLSLACGIVFRCVFEEMLPDLTWPRTLPPGWSVKWDPSPPTMTLPSDATYGLHRGIRIDDR